MQTPPGPEGLITEQIMREWRESNPDADTSTYNRTYEATLATVRAKLAADRVTPPARPSTPLLGVNANGVIIVGPSLLETLAFRP